jgi:uncharacterized BrkB/YihY/UPF0761 family membrane protein
MGVLVLWIVIGLLFAAAYKRWLALPGDTYDPMGGLLIVLWPVLVPMFLLFGGLHVLYRLIPVGRKKP